MVWHPTGAWDWKVVVMAHLENYTASQVNAMLNHYGREEDDGVKRSNENIRPDATASNYVVLAGAHEPSHNTRTCAIGTRIRIRKQIDATNKVRAAKGKRKMNSRATVMCDVVFTLPKDWPKERDPYEFFKLCHEFLRKRYGDACSLPGFVHMDETTPHMHCPIVPMVDGEIRKRDLITRADLRSFHGDLQAFVDKELGFHVSVLLDESQTVEKAKSKLTQDELDALNKDTKAEVDKQVASERAEIRSKASELKQREEDLADGEIDLKSRLRNFETQAEDVTNRRLAAEALERANAEKWDAIVKESRKLKDERQAFEKEKSAFKGEKKAFREKKKDLVRRETAVSKREAEVARRETGLNDLIKQLGEWWESITNWLGEKLDKARLEEAKRQADEKTSVVVKALDEFEYESHEDENTFGL